MGRPEFPVMTSHRVRYHTTDDTPPTPKKTQDMGMGIRVYTQELSNSGKSFFI